MRGAVPVRRLEGVAVPPPPDGLSPCSTASQEALPLRVFTEPIEIGVAQQILGIAVTKIDRLRQQA